MQLLLISSEFQLSFAQSPPFNTSRLKEKDSIMRSLMKTGKQHLTVRLPDWLGEELAPSWSKATFRRGIALRGLKRFDMAISAFAQGQDQDAWQT